MSEGNLWEAGVALLAGIVVIKGVKHIAKEIKKEKVNEEKNNKKTKMEGYGLW